MSAAKPLASLSSGLLARKGAARPAMRSQLALSPEEQRRVVFSMGEAAPAVAQDDLGWNDMGDDSSGFAQFHDGGSPDAAPVIVQQLEALAAAVAEMPPIATQRRLKGGKPVRSALAEGRKAAFTLRLDQYRHLRLRLACTLDSRSAQSVLIEALDRFLADQPGLEVLARRATRN
ncbi:MAG: hypothetical protein C0409_09640 [Novosphingobium sp.]|nr:hypothetical protein [Novosphingobium sp.]